MKAHLFHQPYATAILHGRMIAAPYDTDYRGNVLITTHKKPLTYRDIIDRSSSFYASELRLLTCEDPSYDQHGYAIALADLVLSRPFTRADQPRTGTLYREGLHYWEFDNVRRIVPLPLEPGKKGWTEVPMDVIGKIEVIKLQIETV